MNRGARRTSQPSHESSKQGTKPGGATAGMPDTRRPRPQTLGAEEANWQSSSPRVQRQTSPRKGPSSSSPRIQRHNSPRRFESDDRSNQPQEPQYNAGPHKKSSNANANSARGATAASLVSGDALTVADLDLQLERIFTGNVSLAERKRFFQQQCLRWHPDKNPDNSEQAKQMFQQLQDRKSWFLS